MKARDIVPNWPKPRSTVVLWQDWEDYEWFSYVRGPFGWRGSQESLNDLKLDAEYHARQKAMLDEYLSRYRTPRLPKWKIQVRSD